MMKSTSNVPISNGVRWRSLCLVLLLFAVISAAAGAGMAYWVLSRYTLHMPLQTQALKVRLPAQLPVEVEILPPDADGAAAREVTQLHEFPIHINENFQTVVRVDTRVPIRMNVPFKGEVPVDIKLPLDTRIKTRVLGINMELPIQGNIPLQFKLPVDLLIPINQTVQMKFDLPVNTKIDQLVSVRIPTRQAAHITLRSPGLDITLDQGEIAVPLSWLSLVEGADPDKGRRLGPLALPPSPPSPQE